MPQSPRVGPQATERPNRVAVLTPTLCLVPLPRQEGTTQGRLPETDGQNLVWTLLHVPCSLDSGLPASPGVGEHDPACEPRRALQPLMVETGGLDSGCVSWPSPCRRHVGMTYTSRVGLVSLKWQVSFYTPTKDYHNYRRTWLFDR